MSDRYPLTVENEIPAVAPALPPLPAKSPLEKPLTPAEIEPLQERIVAALCQCFDPEIPVNIYELGLIYEITIAPSAAVEIKMTLTSPGCPVAGTLPGDVQRRVLAVEPVTAAKVDVVWEPQWTPARMSEAARLQLGIEDF